MNNISERQKDILSIIRGLDISPTLYHNAVEKYQALGNFLNDNGLEAEIYPQGSFAFGTVVRPSAKDSSASYDLDFICQVTGTRDNYTPSGLRDKVERVLKSNKVYADRLKIDDTCFTIEYADIGEIGFSIDIVPAADESDQTKQRLILKSSAPALIDTSISIPRGFASGLMISTHLFWPHPKRLNGCEFLQKIAHCMSRLRKSRMSLNALRFNVLSRF